MGWDGQAAIKGAKCYQFSNPAEWRIS